MEMGLIVKSYIIYDHVWKDMRIPFCNRCNHENCEVCDLMIQPTEFEDKEMMKNE